MGVLISVDLYNGAYYVDYNRGNVKAENYAGAGTAEFKNKKLQVGDVVYRDYDGFVMSEGVFGQLEYNRDKLSAFVSGSVSITGVTTVSIMTNNMQSLIQTTI